jgi:hypothetical protein
MFPASPSHVRCHRDADESDKTRPGINCTVLLMRTQHWGAARLCQRRSRITATSVMPSATRLGTITATPEAKASIATQSKGLSTKRGTIRSSFPNDTQRILRRFRSSGYLKQFDASRQKSTKPRMRSPSLAGRLGRGHPTDLKGRLRQEEQPTEPAPRPLRRRSWAWAGSP